jgi:Tfp pilus assembly protein PilN
MLLTLFFYGDYLRARSTYKNVQKEWARLNPLMSKLKAMEAQIEIEMRGEKEFLEKSVLNKDSMTQLLSWVSEYLPPKGWLTELKAERDGEGYRLILKGVVLPSRAQTGIEQIEAYMQQLKAKLPPKAKLSLTTSKESKEKSEGTAFVAEWDWGVKK